MMMTFLISAMACCDHHQQGLSRSRSVSRRTLTAAGPAKTRRSPAEIESRRREGATGYSTTQIRIS